MSRSSIRIIIVLATIIFTGLVSTQIVWVKRAYQLADEQTSHEIELALISVVHSIQRHSGDSMFLVDPVKQVDRNFYRVQISEELQPYYLESLLRTEFLNRELNFDFELNIYNCFNDSVVYRSMITNEEDRASLSNQTPEMQWEDDGHYFAVFFPTLDFEILGNMKFWVASNVVLLAVLIFFTYVINVILKQKRLSEVKTDFINNMTHELKTPISTINLAAEALLHHHLENEPEKIQTYSSIIKVENKRLQEQVDRVLQIAKLDKNTPVLNRSALHANEIIEDAIATIEMNFSEKNISIKTALSAENDLIFGDEVHVTNILCNLLDNAAKYGGDEPQISVATSVHKKLLKVSVSDRGPGIQKEHQRHIFDKFYRIPTGNVHDVKGFGLGLHYVKTMCEAQGGKVRLVSSPGLGTTFEVYFPLWRE